MSETQAPKGFITTFQLADLIHKDNETVVSAVDKLIDTNQLLSTGYKKMDSATPLVRCYGLNRLCCFKVTQSICSIKECAKYSGDLLELAAWQQGE